MARCAPGCCGKTHRVCFKALRPRWVIERRITNLASPVTMKLRKRISKHSASCLCVLMTRGKAITFRQLFLLCSLLSGFVFITPGKAQLPGVNLGATSFFDGLPPLDGPGFYLEQYFQYYNASRLLDNDGNEVELPTSRGTFETPHLQAWVMLTPIGLSIKSANFAEGPVGPHPYAARSGNRRESRRFHRVSTEVILLGRHFPWSLHPMGSYRQ